MRADSALSHLRDGEPCIATLKDGTQCAVRWSRRDWCFFHAGTNAVCPHDDIREWRLASIRFDQTGQEFRPPEKGSEHGQAS